MPSAKNQRVTVTSVVSSQGFSSQGFRFPVADALYERAQQVLPGGSTRSSVFVKPHPAYAMRGDGCRITDADGHVVIDLLNNFTSLIHGHGHPQIVAAATEAIADGSAFGQPTEYEIELAELLAQRLPSAERWRFGNSGTEAVMLAIRAARAYTGRELIVRFEGCYHGMYDLVANDRRGVTRRTVEDSIILPVGDGDGLAAALDRDGDRVAAVIIDAMPSRAGMVPATPEFMRLVRQLTTDRGILLIQDEVITLRVAPGGIQSHYGCDPDLTTVGKIVGGGFPVGAFGGRADIMDVFSPQSTEPVVHNGTFSANPLSLRAGLAAMHLMTESEYVRINALGDRMRDGLRHQGWNVAGLGSLVKINDAMSGEVWWRLYEGGVLLANYGLACISTPMTEETVDEALSTFARVASRTLGGPSDLPDRRGEPTMDQENPSGRPISTET